ncbi:MAG: hypothetical protein K6A15_08185 [Treponema sp.]|nr:hypothetical protein [Treponema sp.]
MKQNPFFISIQTHRPSLLVRLTMVEPKMARYRSPFPNGSAIVGEFKSKMAQ